MLYVEKGKYDDDNMDLIGVYVYVRVMKRSAGLRTNEYEGPKSVTHLMGFVFSRYIDRLFMFTSHWRYFQIFYQF